MRSAAFIAGLLAIPAAVAFVPAPTMRTRTGLVTMQAAITDDTKAGSSLPFEQFDPLGLSRSGDYKKLRESELKHGRVAMLATVGILAQEKFHPFFGLGNQQLGAGIYHFQEVQNVAPFFWTALLFAVALVESRNISEGWQSPEETDKGTIATLKSSYVTGDLGFDPFKLMPKDDAGFFNMRTKELNNGRLAMLAMLGIVLQELKSQQPIF